MAGYSLKEIFKDDPKGYADYKAGQKSGKWADYNEYSSGGSGGSSGNNSVIQNAIKLQQEANKPAVQSLQASIPEVGQKYTQMRGQLQAEKTPLETRYANLLASIKGNKQTAENRQTTTTANELAKRGLTNDSTLFQQELTNAVNPITQQYSTQETDVGLQGEAALRDLANQIANSYTGETADTRSIRNAIAQLQSGAASTGIGQGLTQQYQNQQMAFQQQQAEQARKNAEAERALQNLIYQTISLPQSQATISNLTSLASNRGETTLDKLKAIFGS